MTGKAYANRKRKEMRPVSDFYATPTSLVLKLKPILDNIPHKLILEPACGDGNISDTLRSMYEGSTIEAHDIRTDSVDFLTFKPTKRYDVVVTNPPFSLFDEFVMKAKECADNVVMIGKTNFFGAYQRRETWRHLKDVRVFNRQVDYRSNESDGCFKCGCLVTGWFVWDMSYNNDSFAMRVMDVNDCVSRKVRHVALFQENL